MISCCTCATFVSAEPCDESCKTGVKDVRVGCCGRLICGKCIQKNPRFATYCPYCQITNTPSLLPQGLKHPPSYTASHSTTIVSNYKEALAPPPYSITTSISVPGLENEKKALQEKDEVTAEDALHFLDHERDSIASLSLRYGVPASALRLKNNIGSDHLLLGRRTILIPGEYYRGGVSLSPRPIEGEEEERRKGKIRRFMTTCKVADYDIALLYLEQYAYDLAMAIDAHIADEDWEKTHSQSGRRRTEKLPIRR